MELIERKSVVQLVFKKRLSYFYFRVFGSIYRRPSIDTVFKIKQLNTHKDSIAQTN